MDIYCVPGISHVVMFRRISAARGVCTNVHLNRNSDTSLATARVESAEARNAKESKPRPRVSLCSRTVAT